MIIEGILAVIKFIVLGVIKLFPSIPKIDIYYLDSFIQVLGMADLLVNVRVLVSCFVILFAVMNAELIWGLIMWVVRKLPFIK